MWPLNTILIPLSAWILWRAAEMWPLVTATQLHTCPQQPHVELFKEMNSVGQPFHIFMFQVRGARFVISSDLYGSFPAQNLIFCHTSYKHNFRSVKNLADPFHAICSFIFCGHLEKGQNPWDTQASFLGIKKIEPSREASFSILVVKLIPKIDFIYFLLFLW